MLSIFGAVGDEQILDLALRNTRKAGEPVCLSVCLSALVRTNVGATRRPSSEARRGGASFLPSFRSNVQIAQAGVVRAQGRQI